MGLHEHEVDLEERGDLVRSLPETRHVRGRAPESRKVHQRPLIPEPATILSRYPRECPGNPLIFATAKTGRPLNLRHYNRDLRRAAEAAGIAEPKRVTSHMLRDTAGTLIGEATGSDLAVMFFFGHSSNHVARRYILAKHGTKKRRVTV